MALLDFLNRNKKDTPVLSPVLPRDIYEQGELELADTIAPAALKVGAREIELESHMPAPLFADYQVERRLLRRRLSFWRIAPSIVTYYLSF